MPNDPSFWLNICYLCLGGAVALALLAFVSAQIRDARQRREALEEARRRQDAARAREGGGSVRTSSTFHRQDLKK